MVEHPGYLKKVSNHSEAGRGKKWKFELKELLTILKLARDLQQVLSSQEPLTPWHLHSTFMFRSSSCKKIGLVFLSEVLDYSLSPCRYYAFVSWLFHRVMLVWVWKRSFCPDPPPSPYYCGCRQIMESTFHIFCLWHPHFDVPMFQSRAKKESAESWSKLHKILLFQLSPVLQSCASIFYFLWKTL